MRPLFFIAASAFAALTVYAADGMQRPAISDLPRTTIVIGGAPDWMTSSVNTLWIANITLKEVDRVNAATNTVTTRIKVHGVPCSGIAYGFGSVWVPLCGPHGAGSSLVRIDTATNRVKATLPIPPANSEGAITTSPDSVWLATADGILSRIAPATGSVRQKIHIASGSQNPVYAEGMIWITSGAANLLTVVDASSGRRITTIPIASKPHFITAGGGAVWTIDQGDGSITKVDLRSKRVVATIHAKIPGFGGDITFGSGSAWATVVGTPLTNVDATRNAVVKQWYGPGGDAICFGNGSLWLVNYNGGIVWRINPASPEVR